MSVRPAGIGSISDGSDSVNRSPPTENSTSYCSRNFADRSLHARRGKRRGGRNELAIDRRADQFGEFNEFGMRFRARYRIAGNDSGPLASARIVSACFAATGTAAQLRRDAGWCQQIDLALGFENVARQRQEHRAGRRGQRRLRRAVEEPRQIGEAMHFGRPFHQRPRDRRQIGPQDRFGCVEVLIVLPGGDQDRAAGLLRVIKHAHGIAEAGCDVKIAYGELAGGLGITVGHADYACLLQGEHVAQFVFDRERIHQRQFGGAGIAEQNLDALLLEQLKKGAFSTHCGQGVSSSAECRSRYWQISNAVSYAGFAWPGRCWTRSAAAPAEPSVVPMSGWRYLV